MNVKPIKTHKIHLDEDLFSILDKHLPKLREKSVVAITSKIVSLCEGAVVKKDSVASKKELARKEADTFFEPDGANPHNTFLTIKNGILIPSAGIDESNAEDFYIVYPRDINGTAEKVWSYLRKRNEVKELGIIITDSKTTPLRWGVTGVCLGWCGFKALYSYIGKLDCFGRPLRSTKRNNIDALATAAVFEMGEGAEQTPLAIIEELTNLEFSDSPPTAEERKHLTIPMSEDIYAPIFKNLKG